MLLTFATIQTVALVSFITHHIVSNKPKFKCYSNNGLKHYKFY